MRYRTEIFVPADRYVCLQLPDYLPEGMAVVTVQVEGPGRSPLEPGTFEGPERLDVEWWEELDDEPRRPS